jgi:hypothetical protein
LLKFSENEKKKRLALLGIKIPESNTEDTESESLPNLAHDRFGHVNKQMITRTVRSNPIAPKTLDYISQ